MSAVAPGRSNKVAIIGARPVGEAVVTGWRRVALVCVLWALGGCSSVHFGYNQAPRLAWWWLDGYVNFDDAQAPGIKSQIAAWLQWHRRTQLPDYATLLARAQQEVVDPTTPELACRWFDVASTRADTAFEQALPGFVALVQVLKPVQIDSIRRKVERNNEVFRKDYLQADPDDRRSANVKRVIERSETLYGRLDAAQRQQIATALTQSPFDPERWLAERADRQQDLLQTLTRLVADRPPAHEIEIALRGLKERTEHSPRPAYRVYEEALITSNCRLAAQIHNLTTSAQRRNAVQTLHGWENELRELAVEQDG